MCERKTTQMNIALSPEDKKFLKVYAAERDVAVADIIHEWINNARKEIEENAKTHDRR